METFRSNVSVRLSQAIPFHNFLALCLVFDSDWSIWNIPNLPTDRQADRNSYRGALVQLHHSLDQFIHYVYPKSYSKIQPKFQIKWSLILIFPIKRDVGDFGNFPEFDEKADADGNLHHEVGLVVANVKKNDDILTDVPEYRANLKTRTLTVKHLTWQATTQLILTRSGYVRNGIHNALQKSKFSAFICLLWDR